MNIKFPQTTEQAAEFLREAITSGSAVIPAGGLTSLKNDPAVENPSVTVISARDLRQFSPEPENLLAVAGAGLTPDQVEEALRPTGLYWPVTGLGSRTLGGIMAEGLLGAETMARGSMLDWILGTTLVNPQGQIVSSGGHTLKNVSGYDFTRLAWRSRGRLGLCASFILKLLPRPVAAPVLEIKFEEAGQAARAAEEIITRRLWPEALRLDCRGREADLLVWLTGFPEVVEAKRAAVAALTADHQVVRHEDGFGFWRKRGAVWAGPDSAAVYLGSRRSVLDLAAAISAGTITPERAELDVGGGRAGLLWPEGSDRPDLPGLVLDRFVSSGAVYDRLKKGLDPADLIFPQNLTQG